MGDGEYAYYIAGVGARAYIIRLTGNRVVFVMRIFQGRVGIVRFVRGPGAGGRKRWQKNGRYRFTTQKHGRIAERLLLYPNMGCASVVIVKQVQ